MDIILGPIGSQDNISLILDMSLSQIIVTFFWIGFGIFVMIFSFRLGLGSFNNPDAGLLPFLLGGLLSFLCFCDLTIFLLGKRKFEEASKEEKTQISYRKIGFVIASLFIYSFILEKLGFVITTWIFLILLFRGMGNKWMTTFAASIFTVLATYFVFTFFGVRFPSGIFK